MNARDSQLAALKRHHKLNDANLTTLELLAQSQEDNRMLLAENRTLRASLEGGTTPRQHAQNVEDRKRLIEENDALHKQLEEATKINKEMSRRLHDTRMHLQGLESGRALAIEQAKESVVSVYRSKMGQVEQRARQEKIVLETQLAEVTNQYKSLQCTERQLQAELATLRQQFQEQLESEEDVGAKLAQERAKVEELQQTVSDLQKIQADHTTIDDEYSILHTQLQEAQDDVEAFRERVSVLQSERDDAMRQLQRHTDRQTLVRGSTGVPRTESGVLAHLSSQRMKAEMESSKEREARMAEDVKELERQVAGMERTTGTLRARLVATDDDLRTLKEALAAERDVATRLRAELDQARSDLRRAESDVRRVSGTTQFAEHVTLKRRARAAEDEVSRLQMILNRRPSAQAKGRGSGRGGVLFGSTIR